jgi:NAD(P)-dependent dehydrogenase (short-subunit alcohol dehydrogenase family)
MSAGERIDDDMRFEGKVLVSTGAASGIANAVCKRFVQDGGSVVGLDVNPDVVAAMKELDRAIGVQADVSDEAEVATAILRARDEFGRIDSLYNGAAILIDENAITGDIATYRKMLEVNAVGTLIVTREAAPDLRRAKGAVVNTSSVVVDQARNERSLYAATKGTIPPLTRHLAMELAPDVRVNAVSPGPTYTGMTKGHYEAQGETLDEALDVVGRQVLLRRVASPGELAAAICFLFSDDASFITGTVLNVDGGFCAI